MVKGNKPSQVAMKQSMARDPKFFILIFKNIIHLKGESRLLTKLFNKNKNLKNFNMLRNYVNECCIFNVHRKFLSFIFNLFQFVRVCWKSWRKKWRVREWVRESERVKSSFLILHWRLLLTNFLCVYLELA